jgi:hypothetical protein
MNRPLEIARRGAPCALLLAAAALGGCKAPTFPPNTPPIAIDKEASEVTLSADAPVFSENAADMTRTELAAELEEAAMRAPSPAPRARFKIEVHKGSCSTEPAFYLILLPILGPIVLLATDAAQERCEMESSVWLDSGGHVTHATWRGSATNRPSKQAVDEAIGKAFEQMFARSNEKGSK